VVSIKRFPIYFAYADYYLMAAMQRLIGPGTDHRSNGEFSIIRSILHRHTASSGNQRFCFVDAGAERGLHSSYVLEVSDAIDLKDLKLIAIEPLPVYANQLRETSG